MLVPRHLEPSCPPGKSLDPCHPQVRSLTPLLVVLGSDQVLQHFHVQRGGLCPCCHHGSQCCCRPGRAMAALLALLVLLGWPAATSAVTGDSLLNVCMDAKHHKTEPGPEGQLYGQVWSSSTASAPAGVTCCGVTRMEAGGSVPRQDSVTQCHPLMGTGAFPGPTAGPS